MKKYAAVNPTNGEVLEEFDSLTDAEATAALERSASAYRSWHREDLKERQKVLFAIAEAHRTHSTELAHLTALEMGKPLAQAKGEIELSASIYEYYAREATTLLADEELEIAGSGQAVVRTASIGPLLGIMPWNFPYYQVARFVAPNLLLGNTILLKHASSCPQQALRIEQILREAGTPEGVYQNIFATSDQIADLIASPKLQGVSLTGSERAGSIVGAQAGKYMKKCVLELGGSDPFLVLSSADATAAAKAAAEGRFRNAGQICSSSKRMIVDESQWETFVETFVEHAQEFTTGDPLAESTKMGPMASLQARTDLSAQVADAITKGATVHTGGQIPEGPGAYYPATVLSGVTPEMRAFHEELFGPVAVLHRVASAEEAIELANDSPFGLGGAVFTNDQQEAAYVSDRLEVGMVGINTTIKSAPDLPFGGVKASGIGRELGKFGLNEFANKKLIRHP
ncbi:NAD-dependent succinate-semialdehyde dehydrogenase [Paeniglutamicibacter terrestris]|uniref:NAD-dependent succinate-semialdehyde dehydrogenase n=1 Tax=Paeniglutamicibacter terrestris TaxID=2723403 RepID=A0ABX1G1E8_9MICC|nr:NAD-dependent succinate-semialdehyde dehydrogenase [Paeniglutamicibacter terrestris]NKG19823.1 NAD-dependent succinate-semialdehyde dehydrogenase [Paeniglutamicibacter terrestris]